MPHFAIKNRWTDAVLFEGNFDTMRLCVERAYLSRADLSGADLSGAYLSRADLSGADLSGADLSGAYLSRADLSGADLSGANLSGAYLSGANLSRANLSGADLSGANLSGANLSGANLSRANLSGAAIREGVKVRALRKVCSRTDGHQFHLWDCEDGQWRVTAGCRFFTLEQAWKHWKDTRDNTPLGEETFDILVMFEHQAERDDAARSAEV